MTRLQRITFTLWGSGIALGLAVLAWGALPPKTYVRVADRAPFSPYSLPQTPSPVPMGRLEPGASVAAVAHVPASGLARVDLRLGGAKSGAPGAVELVVETLDGDALRTARLPASQATGDGKYAFVLGPISRSEAQTVVLRVTGVDTRKNDAPLVYGDLCNCVFGSRISEVRRLNKSVRDLDLTTYTYAGGTLARLRLLADRLNRFGPGIFSGHAAIAAGALAGLLWAALLVTMVAMAFPPPRSRRVLTTGTLVVVVGTWVPATIALVFHLKG